MTAALGRRLLFLGVRPEQEAYRKTPQEFMAALASIAGKLARI